MPTKLSIRPETYLIHANLPNIYIYVLTFDAAIYITHPK